MSYQVGVVEAFFCAREPHLTQAIAHEMRERYRQSEQAVSLHDDDAPAMRYLWMREQLLPPAAKSHPQKSPLARVLPQ